MFRRFNLQKKKIIYKIFISFSNVYENIHEEKTLELKFVFSQIQSNEKKKKKIFIKNWDEEDYICFF